jgi:hypothetical protein
MYANAVRALCTAAVAAVFATAPVAADTELPTSAPHVPLKFHRNPDGSVKHGPRGEADTENWSGYAVTSTAPYTSASGTFQVPEIKNDGTTGDIEWIAQWVGIGGYFDATLIQLGISGLVDPSGSTYYYPWYELIPAGSLPVNHPVTPGDIVTASLQCVAACSPTEVQTWELKMTDETAGWSWMQTVQYQSSLGSAEWILEAPWLNGELPLADYVQANFADIEANGLNPNVSVAANGIQMSDPWGETSNPSYPANGDDFSSCWGRAPSYTACVADIFTPPPPTTTVSLSASPKKISVGQSSTLTWSSRHASSCTGHGFAVSGRSGKAVVQPTVTTAYAITCSGPDNSAAATATVTVRSPKLSK